MVRPQQALGRPGTAVITPGWGRNHSPVLDKTMTAKVSLYDPTSTGSSFSEEDQATVFTAGAAYSIDECARIQALTDQATNRDKDAAEESTTVAGYLVAITLDRTASKEPEVGHLVKVTCSSDQVLANGTVLRVTDVVLGSERFQRDLLCTLTRPSVS